MQEQNKFLVDVHDKKDNNWKERKLMVRSVQNSYSSLRKKGGFYIDRWHKREHALDGCGTFLEFKRYETGEFKLHKANFCKVRLCPMCAWRRSLKVFGQVSAVMGEIEKQREYRYIFLTLTARNVDGQFLDTELNAYYKAFDNLVKLKDFKNAVKGWFRALEITRNAETGQYHPHFHIILAVNKSYFTSNYYLTHAAWTEMWRSCLGIDYTPIVDVRTVKPKQKTGSDYNNAVAEVAKYSVTPSDYENNPEVIETLDLVLHGRRLVAFGGIMKDAHKQLKLGDTIDGDLTKTKLEDTINPDIAYVIEFYEWHVGYKNYILVSAESEENNDKSR